MENADVNVPEVVNNVEKATTVQDKKQRRRKTRKVKRGSDIPSPAAGAEPVVDIPPVLPRQPLRRSGSTESLVSNPSSGSSSSRSSKKKTVAERHAANDKRRFSKADSVAKAIHVACKESGFIETGQNFQTCAANFLEKNKLLPLYDKSLRSDFEKACDSEKERIRAKMFLIRTLKPNVSFKVGIISGVAGSGKSTLIRKLVSVTDVTCVLANPRLKETDFKGQGKTFTLQQALLSIVPLKADVIFVDEYTLAQSAELLFLQRKLQCSFLVLFGDVAQGDAHDASSLEYLQIPVIYRSTVSHRLGNQTAEFCRKHGQSFTPGSKVDDVILWEDYLGETESTDKNIAFSQATVKDLADVGVEASLVLDTQGKEYDSVTLFVRVEDKEAIADPHLRAVAFTRHRRKLIIRADPDIRTSISNGEFNVKTAANSHKYGVVKHSYGDGSSAAAE